MTSIIHCSWVGAEPKAYFSTEMVRKVMPRTSLPLDHICPYKKLYMEVSQN